MDFLLDELRVRYSEEESRREGVDNKAGILLAGDAIVISVLATSPADSFAYTVALLLALESAVVALACTRISHYLRVGGKYGDFYRYGKSSHEAFADQFVMAYMRALEHNSARTSKRQWGLAVAYYLFFAALVAMAVLLLA